MAENHKKKKTDPPENFQTIFFSSYFVSFPQKQLFSVSLIRPCHRSGVKCFFLFINRKNKNFSEEHLSFLSRIRKVDVINNQNRNKNNQITNLQPQHQSHSALCNHYTAVEIKNAALQFSLDLTLLLRHQPFLQVALQTDIERADCFS